MVTRLCEVKEKFDTALPTFKERIKQQCPQNHTHSPKWKWALKAENWFENLSKRESAITNKINTWNKDKACQWKGGDLFHKTQFKYLDSEQEKILKHREWEKRAIIAAKVAAIVLGIVSVASIGAVCVSAGLAYAGVLAISQKALSILGSLLPLQIFGALAPFYAYFGTTDTLRERKVRVIEDKAFQRFVEDYVVRKDEEHKYPDEQLLTDKKLHEIYHIYQRDLYKTKKYVTRAQWDGGYNQALSLNEGTSYIGGLRKRIKHWWNGKVN